MTSEPLDRSLRLPFRRLLLMPWRWNRWSIVAAVIFSLGPFPVYVLFLPVVEQIATQLNLSDGCYEALDLCSEPAFWCADNFPIIDTLWVVEYELIDDCLVYWYSGTGNYERVRTAFP